MTNSKQTKRALFSSVLALLLCFTMLLGTTFAWFTDSASTSVNKIQAGTLDVALEVKENGEWVSAEGKTLDFVKAEGHEDEEILWEPGCTYNLPTLRIVNKGNLALKYKVVITGINGDAELNKAIEWTIGEVAMGTERHLLAGANAEFTISGHMKEDAGNNYQGLSIDGIAITVYATQDTVENDSNDNQYDKDAEIIVAGTTADVTNAIKGEGTVITIAVPSNGTVELENDVANNAGKDITFIGDGSQTVDIVEKAVTAEGGELNYQRGSSFTFENLTVQAGTGAFDGIVCDELTYKNCVIKGKITLYGKATFIDCVFENDMEDQYSIWTWGGTDVKFENCTFKTACGKAILLYGSANTNLTVNNCTFIDGMNGEQGKAAVSVGNDYNATYTLTATNNTIYGFAVETRGTNTGTKMYGNKNSMDAEHLIVTCENNVDGVAADLYITTAEELFAFAESVNEKGIGYAGKTIVLLNDIDLANKEWTPIGQTGGYGVATTFQGTFDGNGHTISNLKIASTNEGGNYAVGLFGFVDAHGATIKNVNVDGASIAGHHWTGVIVGYMSGTIENCTVKNAAVNCTNANNDANGDKAGVIAGHVNIGVAGVVKNCKAENCTVSANRDAGQIVGCTKSSYVVDCTATSVTVSGDGTNIRNELIGRVLN